MSRNTRPYPAMPIDGGVRGAGEEALGVEEGAQAPERDADHDRRGDARPSRQRLPAAAVAAAHQGRLAPAGHLPLRGEAAARRAATRSEPGGRRLGLAGFLSRGEQFGRRRVRDGDARFFGSSCSRLGRPDGGRRSGIRQTRRRWARCRPAKIQLILGSTADFAISS